MPDEAWSGTVDVRIIWQRTSGSGTWSNLFIGKICCGNVVQYPEGTRLVGKWRGWIMNSDDGEEIGNFPTEAEAKAALVRLAMEALNAR